MQNQLFPFSIVVVLFGATASFAHDGNNDHVHALPHDNTRIWTMADSKSTISGTFVAVRDGKAHIRREDGWVRPVEINRLTETDQLWIESRQREIAAIKTQPEYILTTQRGQSAASSAAASELHRRLPGRIFRREQNPLRSVFGTLPRIRKNPIGSSTTFRRTSTDSNRTPEAAEPRA